MESAKPRRRLIVNADDFGLSSSVNRAVIQAHREGILTSASLMVNGEGFEEAVALAKENPKLGVGLHLTLSCGSSTLSGEKIPALANEQGIFRHSPVIAGMKYFFLRAARSQLRDEIAAQFEKFQRTRLMLDHVNGHLHFHLHPAVFSLLQEEIRKHGVRAVRFTNDPLKIDWPLGSGRWFYRLSHAFIFRRLSQRTRPFLRTAGIKHTEYVFGLLENGRISEDYVLKLLRVLPAGDSELYSHPSLDEFRHEYEALLSPRVKQAIAEERIELIRYQDL
jgi:chitin disaccharide deacetylase